MSPLVPLVLILAILGAPRWDGAAGVSVAFSDDGPPGIFGVACDSEQFGHVEGNAQALCEGVPDGNILIYPDEVQFHAKRDRIPVRDLFVNLLRHESAHLELGADADNPDVWDRFRHHEVHEIACEYAPVRYCRSWLAEGAH